MFQILSILVVIAVLTLAIPKVCVHKSKPTIIRILWVIFVIYLIGNLYCTTFSRVPNSGRMLDLRPFKTYFELFKEPLEGGGEVTGGVSQIMCKLQMPVQNAK